MQNSRDIFVQWDRLQPCRDVNGNITHYQVQYQAQPTEANCRDANVDFSIRSELVPGVFDRNGNATLTGLSYFTNYSIRVAAVNEEGDVGIYSEPIFQMTPEHSETSGVCCLLLIRALLFFSSVPGSVKLVTIPSFFKIIYSWSCPEMPNGKITTYEVEYWLRDEPQNVTVVNTTDLATSYTVSGLRSGTEINFSVRAYTKMGPGDRSFITKTTLTKPRKLNVTIPCK